MEEDMWRIPPNATKKNNNKKDLYAQITPTMATPFP
jgi:hypothetical protein